MPEFDLVITNARVVTYDETEPIDVSIGVKDGSITRLAPHIEPATAMDVVDAGGKLAFPGAVDAHQHWGIYNPLDEDVVTESNASAQGGVTSGITYMRTGQYYMNRGGPYSDVMPQVLAACQGRARIDYAFHLAPMTTEHIDELPSLVDEFGVTSFKIFMFYGGFGLHGASDSQRDFLMLPEGQHYDYAHFEFVMRGVQQLRTDRPELADRLSLSLHCETAEIMRAYSEIVKKDGTLTGLEAYSASRPPHSEGLAISIASYLAHETDLPTINLLHLSSAKAMEAALTMAAAFPHIDFRREVTIGHLLADFHSAASIGGKVNPPLRSPEDVEALWGHLLAGDIDWVVSDHACCREEMKFGDDHNDVLAAKSGFGGAEYLLPGLVSEGHKRGLSYQRIAQLVSRAPARRFGLDRKGDIAVGFDADIALIDPESPHIVHASDSMSAQQYTPFEGFELGATVTDTFVRGHRVLADGKIHGSPKGRYLHRATSAAARS